MDQFGCGLTCQYLRHQIQIYLAPAHVHDGSDYVNMSCPHCICRCRLDICRYFILLLRTDRTNIIVCLFLWRCLLAFGYNGIVSFWI